MIRPERAVRAVEIVRVHAAELAATKAERDSLQASLEKAGLGPLQLTPALDKIRQEAGLEGILIDGERYDIGGEPHTYLATLNALAPEPGSPEPLGQPNRSPSMVFMKPAAGAVDSPVAAE